jgi:hypothetical protein
MERKIIQCEAGELNHLVTEVLKDFRIVSVTPYKLETERSNFPSPIQQFYVSTFVIIYES